MGDASIEIIVQQETLSKDVLEVESERAKLAEMKQALEERAEQLRVARLELEAISIRREEEAMEAARMRVDRCQLRLPLRPLTARAA